MFKFHQLFSFGILSVLFGTCLLLGIFSYNNQVLQNKEILYEKLHTFFEVVDISILEGSFDSRFLKDLQRRSKIATVIIDKTNNKTYASDDMFFNKQLIFAKQPRYQKFKIKNQSYLELLQNIVIDDRAYDIGVFLPEISGKNWNFWIEFSILFGVFVFLSLGLIFLIKKNTQKELDKIAYCLYKLIQKDFSNVQNSSLIKEFEEISALINKLAFILQKQEKKVKKHSKKLHLKYLQSSSIISALSHEFKNPLAVISGYSEAILQAKDELSLAQRNNFLNKIHSQSQRLNTLLNRLNLAVRLENDLLSLELVSFDFKLLIQEVVSNLAHRYADKKIILKLKDSIIYADKILLENVISNLVENALKYSKTQVKIVLKKQKFKVIDDGEGIEENAINLITKKFYRHEQKYQENSLGLGLFIVKYILKLHHSELKIKSVRHKGSSFSFKF